MATNRRIIKVAMATNRRKIKKAHEMQRVNRLLFLFPYSMNVVGVGSGCTCRAHTIPKLQIGHLPICPALIFVMNHFEMHSWWKEW
jgi:hypothetical protein